MSSMPSVSLMSSAVEPEEVASYFGKNVVTVRKWFRDEPDVIRIPRGRQKPTELYPVTTLIRVLQKMGFPEAMIKDCVEQHRQRVEARLLARQVETAPVPSAAAAPKSDKSATTVKVKKPIKSEKSVKINKNTNLPRTRKPAERRRA